MAPTYEYEPNVGREYKKLTPAQQTAFREARDLLRSNLLAKEPFDPKLRVKGVQGSPGVFEMTWAPDGRATFQYGSEQREGDPHIIWRRIGTHDIFKSP